MPGKLGSSEFLGCMQLNVQVVEPCIKFISKQFESLELPYEIQYINGDTTKPIIIGTWLGSQPELPAILLNSHMDVVPVFADQWTHPPFGAEMDAEGRIYARGAQDMKCVGMQYLAALRILKTEHKQMKRTVHISFVPDEEIGGETSMQEFVKCPYFRGLNIGFALDEGMATADDKFVAFYAERSMWQLKFKFNGTAGHGSLLLDNTAGQKLNYVVDKLMKFRHTQVERLDQDPSLHIGDVTTINLTQLNGGVQSNVIPPQMEAVFDMRLSLEMDLKEFEELLHKWCTEAGGDIEWEWLCRIDTAPATKVDSSNRYWSAVEKVFKKMDLKLETHVFAGGTDSQFLRAIGIPSIGFSPMNNTPVLLHDHDEFLQADVYLKGIEIYHKILMELFNC